MTTSFLVPSDNALFWRRRAGWGRAMLAVGVVAVLLCLAAANVLRANWGEVEDGVLWVERPEGLVADAVGLGSAAARVGIGPGDILLAVDGQPIEFKADLLDVLHASREGMARDYTLVSLDGQELRQLTLQPVPGGEPRVYLVLVGVGILALLIGALVRLRRPDNQATLHFFWLTVAFFGVFTFSFNGRLDRLDWVFYWADAVSTLLLAPLFMHFALVFPERTPSPMRLRLGLWVYGLIYFPALAIGMIQVMVLAGTGAGVGFTRAVEFIWEMEMVYLAACVIGSLAIMIFALQRVPSVTARRQLRWVLSGAVLGGLPFAIGYALPWSLGFNWGGLYLTAIPLGLIPLTFASAIVRYRLRDVEVIVKRGLVYTAAVGAMAAIYLGMEQLATLVFLEESDEHNSIIAGLATAVVVLLFAPVKNAIQTMLDRVYYRDRYDYRRALVAFARDLNSDLDLNRLTDRLVTRVAETLVVDKIILMQGATEGDPSQGGFRPLRWLGFDSPPSAVSAESGLGSRLLGRQTLVLDDPALSHRLPADEEVAVWRARGIYYFVPCVSEEGTIAVMALGRKGSGEPLSSEDMALLAAVAGQVATALENGRLYGQLQQKAAELDRMRQFSENIIESLSDGLVVVDLDGCVVRWNAGLERLYGISRQTAVGQNLESLFDSPFVDRLRKARQEAPSGAVLYRIPLLSRHEDQRRRQLVNVATVPLLTPDGSTSGMMVIVEDITERVQLEEQLQISEKMASVGLLAAGVAHEVNTPLTGISSFTQMLLEGADPDDPTTRVLEKIEQQTFRAAKIVNGLLNMARPGRPDASGLVDINVVVNEVLALLEHQLEAGSVKVRRDLSSSALIVQGVEFKLQQVLLNLLLNARDAMPNGGWLTIRTRVHGPDVVAEVADTGSGISPELLSRIYDPFFTTKTAGQGTGLGLSVSYGVVQEHHGSIECESDPGHGTRFTLSLPRAVPARERTAEGAHGA